MRPQGAVLFVVAPTFAYRPSGRSKCIGDTQKYRSECVVLDSPTEPILFLTQPISFRAAEEENCELRRIKFA